MVELTDLGDIVLREKPRKCKTQAFTMMKKDGAVCQLWQKAKKEGQSYKIAVKKYLEVYASYLYYNKPRQLITDLEKILSGMNAIENHSEEFLARAIKYRDSPEYNGSWDKMLEDFARKRKERPIYKGTNGNASQEEDRKIRELKKIEEEYCINLADYCLAI